MPLWLLTVGAAAVSLKDMMMLVKYKALHRIPFVLAMHLTVPALLWLTLSVVDLSTLATFWKVILTLAVVAPMGPIVYRLIYQPIAKAPVLVLLILSVAMHLSLVGLSLWMFGAEGYRTQAFTDASFMLGEVMISAQSLLVLVVAILLITALYLFFGYTMYGKALRATAYNAEGAQLGGLTSYPLAALGAFVVGLIESYATFFASQYKEVIVFTLVLPFLLWLSLTTNPLDEEH